MKFKVFFISIFLLYSSFSFAVSDEWIIASGTPDKTVLMYFNKDELVKRDGYLLVWLMASFKEPKTIPGDVLVQSHRTLIATDCKKPYTYRDLHKTLFKGPMMTGGVSLLIDKSMLEKRGIAYSGKGSLIDIAIHGACEYGSL